MKTTPKMIGSFAWLFIALMFACIFISFFREQLSMTICALSSGIMGIQFGLAKWIVEEVRS